MKVLVLLPFAFYRPSGSSFNSYFRIRALLDMGHTIDVLAYPHGEDLIFKELTIIRAPKNKIFSDYNPGEYKKKLVYDFFLFFRTIWLIKSNKYDLLITHSSCIYTGIFFKLISKAKFIANVHSNIEAELVKWGITKFKLVSKIAGKFEAFLINKYDSIICNHSSVKEILEKNCKKNSNIYLIRNTIIPDKIYFKKKSSSTFIILYTGTLVQVQNLELIYKTSKLLLNEDIKFIIVGGTDKEIKREEANAALYGANKIEFIKRNTFQELNRHFENADIVISPREFGHDTPMKIIDYLSRGVCILATNKPIHTEILNSENSFLFEPIPEKLAEAIIFLKNRPDIIKRLGEKAKNDFDNFYSFEIMKNKYKILFNDLFQGKDNAM